ncbi:MAG TPA: hypothetical protein VHF06_15225 [Pseudonocardiaceae bacterium]|nr:hypothetical protein [Pseudonocardiaceae bacterium]
MDDRLDAVAARFVAGFDLADTEARAGVSPAVAHVAWHTVLTVTLLHDHAAEHRP